MKIGKEAIDSSTPTGKYVLEEIAVISGLSLDEVKQLQKGLDA